MLDTDYATGLVDAGVVNTMPEERVEATVEHGVAEGSTVLDDLGGVGVSYSVVAVLTEDEAGR